jgi:hypothetical protein
MGCILFDESGFTREECDAVHGTGFAGKTAQDSALIRKSS